MRARSRLTTTAIALLSMLVIGVGLAWACTPAEGGVDETSGSPGDQTNFTGRYFAPGEPVEVRWNDAFENDPNAPLMTVAQADAQGVLRFTVTIPDAEPGHYWIVVNGPGNGGSGGTRFRAAGDYTIEGAVAEEPQQEPGNEEPAEEPSEQPQGSGESQAQDPKPNRPADSTAGRRGSDLREDVAAAPSQRRSDDGSTTTMPVPAGLASAASGDTIDTSRLPVGALLHDPPMAEQPPWKGITEDGDANRAPSLVASTDTGAGPLSQFAVGAAVLGVGLVAMFAGFFVAEIRRHRKVEAALEWDPNRTSS